jgi:RNA polymerase sigma-70 factor (ECF subfamily)
MVAALAETPAANSDESLEVDRAKRDRRAFEPLYLRYFDRVYAYCYRRLGSPDEAADATSLVFSRVLAALPACRSDAFRSWLFAIAHNVLTDQYRARRFDRPIDDALDLPAGGRSPEEEAIAAEARTTVVRLLAELPVDQRHVLELRLAGLTSKEIGEVLGKQANAIDQIQFRAMTRLRSLTTHLGTGKEGGR